MEKDLISRQGHIDLLLIRTVCVIDSAVKQSAVLCKQLLLSAAAAPSGGEEGDGTWWGWRGSFHMSSPPDCQAGAAERPREDQEDQRSGVSYSDSCTFLFSQTTVSR